MTEIEAFVWSLITTGVIALITAMIALFKPHGRNIHVGKK